MDDKTVEGTLLPPEMNPANSVALVRQERVLPQDLSAEDAEQLIVTGDLSKLSAEGRLVYYHKRCRDLGLNPLAQPFMYMKVPHPDIPNTKKLVLYAGKVCGEMLRDIHNISIEVIEEREAPGMFEVKVLGKKGDRSEVELGGVETAGKTGQMLANQRMKAYTKAKRRVTLALCAVGMSDETEVDTIRGAQRVSFEDAGHTEETQKRLGLTPEQQAAIAKSLGNKV